MTLSEYELCLYHHGVKGMKWGIRKKDKYPRKHKGIHDSDGKFNERSQRNIYKKLKKDEFITEVLDKFDEKSYKDAMATRKAAGDLGIYLTEHGRSSTLSKKMNSRAWKNFDKADADWNKADEFINSKNKQIVEELLGKYKDKKIGDITAGQKLINRGEELVSSLMNDYGEMLPHYAKYFE